MFALYELASRLLLLLVFILRETQLEKSLRTFFLLFPPWDLHYSTVANSRPILIEVKNNVFLGVIFKPQVWCGAVTDFFEFILFLMAGIERMKCATWRPLLHGAVKIPKRSRLHPCIDSHRASCQTCTGHEMDEIREYHDETKSF